MYNRSVVFAAAGYRSLTIAALYLAGLPVMEGQDAARLQDAYERLQRGDVQRTIEECKGVLASDPKSAPAHMLLGRAYLARGEIAMIAEAKAELQQALALDPSLIWARFYLARVYLDQGLNDKAKEQLERGLHDRPDIPHFLSLLGEANRKLGNPAASLDLNRKALGIDPSLTPAHYYLALADLDLKQDDAALGELEGAVHSPYTTPEMDVALADLYRKRQRFAEAEELCRKAIAADPSRSEAYLVLARLYNARRASDQTLEVLSRALPEGKPFPASEYYAKLQADIRFEQGCAYQAKGMSAQALEAYSRTLEFDPGRGEAHRRLAELYLKKGDNAHAVEHALAAERFGVTIEPALRGRIFIGR
jgi:tetratricopeptide (TPR) repeat protein